MQAGINHEQMRRNVNKSLPILQYYKSINQKFLDTRLHFFYMKALFSIFITFIQSWLFLACASKDISITLPYSGDKLVVYSQLSPETPVTVLLSKSFNQVGPLPENLKVSGAEVWLIKDGKPLVQLTETEQPGEYTCDSLPEAGPDYQITAKATGFPDVVSEPVILPDFLPTLHYEHTKDKSGTINAHTPQDEFKVWLNANNEPDDNYYLFGLRAVFDEPHFSQSWPSADNTTLNEDECSTNGGKNRGENQYGYYLIKGSCFPGNNLPLKIYLETARERWVNNVIEYERAKRIEIIAGKVTKEVFDLQKANNRNPEGLDLLVIAPQLYHSNIKGGYGLVTASSDFIITIPE